MAGCSSLEAQVFHDDCREDGAALKAVSGAVRHDWQISEIAAIYHSPLLELVFTAARVHRQYHDPALVQQCSLLSVKTGGCSEDCSYCSQSARYVTEVKAEKLLDADMVYEAARRAKENGSTRFCMGAAWREIKNDTQFDQVLDLVKKVKSLDMEVCVTLGMLNQAQAKQLKDAGLTSYNHNLDTGASYYPNVVSTRTYEDRLNTLENVRAAGINVCCGGIVGLGENDDDRIELLHTLATMAEHPESVPVNALVAVEGTPLSDRPPVPVTDMLRMIATARICLPLSVVRLSAGRGQMSLAEQAICFLAGANSIFAGDKLLTTVNPGFDADREMLSSLGLKIKTLES